MGERGLDTLLAAGARHRRTLLYWSDLLNFYSAHKDELDDAEILTLYRHSEECRHYWNVDRVEVRRVRRADGTVREAVSVRKGLNCSREEVATDLYAVADRILRQSPAERPFAGVPQRNGEAPLHRLAMGQRA